MARINHQEKQELIACGIEHAPEIKGLHCHWILMSDDKTKIFRFPLKTKSEAEATLQFENLSGYHPEHHINQFQTSSND